MSQLDLLTEWPSTATVSLFPTLVLMMERLMTQAARDAGVITWGCPVPSFGDPTVAQVASLGLNPSDREFVDDSGRELAESARRFHTLSSLGLVRWEDAHAGHLDQILQMCRDYFIGNPYDRWFRRLDRVVAGTGASFYKVDSPACHLDVIPYATSRKWTDLTGRQRAELLRLTGDSLGRLLSRSSVRVLILNGQSVVSYFRQITGISLERLAMPKWSLPRRSTEGVQGFAYRGNTATVSGHNLPHELLVLGFNHNLQSSFGVTAAVVRSIRQWIAESSRDVLRCCRTGAA